VPRRKRGGADRRGSVVRRERSLAERTAAMEARPRKRTAYPRGKMRSRGDCTAATEVSSAEVGAATTKASTMEAAAVKATAVKAAAMATTPTMATATSGIRRDRQNHREGQYDSACSELRAELQH
ncbi:hypothetical protein OZ411_32550, partial [Bradyrhizobium sp. Arg237L]|uniref:hypothetical protein n=1 Tax=Bradyrhizobium sp. Arg237L TaxID=3003352 RepID=UPI00249E6FED